MASSPRRPPLPCPAWVFSNQSNAHVAKDRSWFGDDYVEFKSSVGQGHGLTGKPNVVGVGTVKLPTKTSPHRSGSGSHGTLVLKRVLHVPSALCNIIGLGICDDYNVEISPDSSSRGSITTRSDGHPVAYFKPNARLCQIRLTGPPVGPKLGPSPFKPSVAYVIRAEWSESEQRRFARLESASAFTSTLTPVERSWLKKYYKSEFKFLQANGLSIYKDEEREQGRHILRAMISRGHSEPQSDNKPNRSEPHSAITDKKSSPQEPNRIQPFQRSLKNTVGCFEADCSDTAECNKVPNPVRQLTRVYEGSEDELFDAIVRVMMNTNKSQMEILRYIANNPRPKLDQNEREGLLRASLESSINFNNAALSIIHSMIDGPKDSSGSEGQGRGNLQ